MNMSESNLVCTTPKIWVFDDLCSDRFLKHVDTLLDSETVHDKQYEVFGKVRKARCVPIEVDEQSQELLEVVKSIANVQEVEPCTKLMVSDIYGDSQDAHIDHASMQDLATSFKKLDFLDTSRQSTSSQDASRIVPTVSLVIYFNDVGGIRFPHAQMAVDTIPAKRGRLVMFNNYIDGQRPNHDSAALHYGFYFPDKQRRRRLMTMGIMANETPSMSQNSAVGGFIYCPGIGLLGHDGPLYGRHDEDRTPDPELPREHYLVTMTAGFDASKKCWTLSCTNLAGEVVSVVDLTKDNSYMCHLRNVIHRAVEGKNYWDHDRKFDVQYCFADGKMMNLLGSNTPIYEEYFPDDGIKLTLTAEYNEASDEWLVACKNVEGEEQCILRGASSEKLSWLIDEVEKIMVSQGKCMWVGLYSPDGEKYGLGWDIPGNKGEANPSLGTRFAK
eukprot:TRINITY_DN16484_c0_g1_i1.p1 TRINITY_DN16484_c0_g1~~TRINITY_DN16484_c0_g1_i1.p1  ORF type:complete len:443 (-),score=76.84 TRINITY_DN16484_c0_g1_i1:1198-2526(-)